MAVPLPGPARPPKSELLLGPACPSASQLGLDRQTQAVIGVQETCIALAHRSSLEAPAMPL